MTLSKWLAKKRQEVLRKWKDNQLSYIDAAVELHRFGVPVHEAWRILAKT